MSQVESTLRCIDGQLIGNRNYRISCNEDWDNSRHITLRRQIATQEAREIAMAANMEGVSALSVSLPENECPVDDYCFDYEGYRRSQEIYDQEAELEAFFQNAESDEPFDNGDDDYVLSDLALPGDITFDTDRASTRASSEDRRWDGLQDDMDAMQDVHCNFQEYEIHLDGISGTHYYHANRTGIIAVDRFDLYGDRNPRAWWPVLECA